MADPRRRFQVVTELSILDNLDSPGYPMELAAWLAEHFVEDAEMRGTPTEARTISVVEVPVPLATGDQLDAERRGECAHHANWYWDEEIGRSRCTRCDAVVGPDRAKDQQDIIREMNQKEI